MRLKTVIACVLVWASASTAQAQQGRETYRGIATGLIGGTLGGDVPDPVLTLGGTVSVQEASGWGTEMDISWAKDNNGSTQKADITAIMIGANWLRSRGNKPVNPYLAFGIGALGLHGCLLPCSAPTTTWNLGLSTGGGVQFAFNDIIGLRGDARYMFAPGSHEGSSRPANWGFWRVSFGVGFGWAVQ